MAIPPASADRDQGSAAIGANEPAPTASRDPVDILGLVIAIISLVATSAVGLWTISTESRASTPDLRLLSYEGGGYSWPGSINPPVSSFEPYDYSDDYSCDLSVRLWNAGGVPATVDHVDGQLILHGDVAQFSGTATSGGASGSASWVKLSRYFWNVGYTVKGQDDKSINDVVVPAYGILDLNVTVTFTPDMEPSAFASGLASGYPMTPEQQASFDANYDTVTGTLRFAMPGADPTASASWSCQHIADRALDAVPAYTQPPSP